MPAVAVVRQQRVVGLLGRLQVLQADQGGFYEVFALVGGALASCEKAAARECEVNGLLGNQAKGARLDRPLGLHQLSQFVGRKPLVAGYDVGVWLVAGLLGDCN